MKVLGLINNFRENQKKKKDRQRMHATRHSWPNHSLSHHSWPHQLLFFSFNLLGSRF